MALYWTSSSQEETYPIDSLQNLPINSQTLAIYAKGEDIALEEFFSDARSMRVLNCIVTDSEIVSFNIKSSNIRGEFKNNVIFEKCQISELIISEFKIPNIKFSECKIGKFQILTKAVVEKIEIQTNTQIKSFQVENTRTINLLSIKDDCLIEEASFKNTHIVNLTIIKSILGTIKWVQGYNVIDNLNLDSCTLLEIIFKDISFNQSIAIKNCSEGILKFTLCEIEGNEFEFKNCSIGLDLNKVKFSSRVNFNFEKSHESRVSLERCYFAEEVQFLGNFTGPDKNFTIHETVFKDLVLFDDDHCKGLVIKQSHFQNGLMLPIKNKGNSTEIGSSVWCILKNQAISRNENIDAIEYRKNEFLSYEHELKASNSKYIERIVLNLNWMSNNHGINWVTGIVFTISAWLVFYILFILAKDNFYCFTYRDCSFLLTKEFWSNAISYLWLPDGLNDLSDALNNNQLSLNSAFMILSFLLGKIAIAYGVFQTISAFRRHGKD